VPAELIGYDIRARGLDTPYTLPPEIARQPPTLVAKDGIACPTGDCIKRGSDQAVSGGIDRMLLEPAGNNALPQQVLGVGFQQIDAPANPAQDSVPATVTPTEIAPEAPFDGIAQQARNQVRELRRLLDGRFELPLKLCQIRGIQKQEPDVADGDSPYQPRSD